MYTEDSKLNPCLSWILASLLSLGACLSGCLLDYDLEQSANSIEDTETDPKSDPVEKNCSFECMPKSSCDALPEGKVHKKYACHESKYVCCEGANGTDHDKDSDQSTDSDTEPDTSDGPDSENDTDTSGDTDTQSDTDTASDTADELRWVTMNDIPYAGGGLTSAVLSDGFHLLGGSSDWWGTQTYQHHYLYDPLTDTWSSSPADIPDANTWGSKAQVYKGRLYLIGGWEKGGTSLRVFDPHTNEWNNLPNIPAEYEYGFVSAVVGDDLYVIGGYPQVEVDAPVYKFDLVGEKWSVCQSIPQNEGAGSLAGAALGDKIYVLGGGAEGQGAILQIYDTLSDSWSRGRDLFSPLEAPSSLAFENKIYFFGGAVDQDTNSKDILNAVHIYNPNADTWSKGKDMQTARNFSTAQVFNGRFHVLGGLDRDFNAISKHEIFTP